MVTLFALFEVVIPRKRRLTATSLKRCGCVPVDCWFWTFLYLSERKLVNENTICEHKPIHCQRTCTLLLQMLCGSLVQGQLRVISIEVSDGTEGEFAFADHSRGGGEGSHGESQVCMYCIVTSLWRPSSNEGGHVVYKRCGGKNREVVEE